MAFQRFAQAMKALQGETGLAGIFECCAFASKSPEQRALSTGIDLAPASEEVRAVVR